MQISRINNYPQTTFGYNKRVNNALNQKLNESEKSPVTETMQKVQENCIFVENKIKSLEGRNYQNVDDNENQINLLSQYLITAKPVLCAWADRLYPELKYTIKEYDTYSSEIVKNMNKNTEGLNKAYYWRNDIIDKLDEYMESVEQIDYTRMKYDDLPFKDDNIDENKGIDDNKEIENKTKNNHNADAENLVKKFTPYSYSPKSLNEVVGINDIKEDVEDFVIYSIKNPEGAIEREKDYGVKRPNFIILYGPPGCGKTMLTEAIAAETECEMYKMDLSNIGTSYINETAVNIKRAFEYVTDIAKKSEKPVILFMDEMDAILSERNGRTNGSTEDSKVVNTILPLLSSLEDNNSNMIVIGATNMYDLLDPAAKSRADNKFYIGLPNEDEIQRLLKMHLEKLRKGEKLANNKEELKELSGELKNYSPRDIVKIIQNAGKKASRRGSDISVQDFKEALKTNSFEKTDENQYKTKTQKTSKLGFLK